MSLLPKIDVITRTRSRPQLLRRCLESILAQTHPDWHWIVINNGDPEPVTLLLQEYAEPLANRALLLHHDEACAIGKLTNLAIRAGSSELITLLDDDDTWQPNFLSATAARLTTEKIHPSVKGVCTLSRCLHEHFDEQGNYTVQKEYLFNPHLRNIHLAALAAVNQFPPNAFVYERSAYEAIGPYDETFPVLDDWDFNLRFNLQFNIDVIPEMLSNYHLRPASAPSALSNTVTAQENLHRFYEGLIINHHLREDLRSGKNGLGTLLANAGTRRITQFMLHTQQKKLEHMSDKIGKIDARTKRLKSELL
jgi:glycosyltransferase involved in cell wall biosynthesis